MSNFTNTLFVGKVLILLEKTDSTNLHAIELLSKNKPSEGTVISTSNQTKGRGQIGRNWLSEPGKNLTFSIIFYPKFLQVKKQFLLNQVVALGVADFLSGYLKHVKIKWPNDIYVGEKKICGILIQNTLSGAAIQSSVVGLGLNINQTDFDPSIPNPTSMAIELHQKVDLQLMLEELCEKIEIRYLQLRGNNQAIIQKDYLHHLFRMQEDSLFLYPGGEAFSGKIVGVSEAGKLRIHTKKGEEQFDVRGVQFVV